VAKTLQSPKDHSKTGFSSLKLTNAKNVIPVSKYQANFWRSFYSKKDISFMFMNFYSY